MTMVAPLIRRLFGSRDSQDLMRERIDAWADWLNPLADGVGRDPGYEDTFFAVKDEATKLADIDDALIVQSCRQLILEVGKDLRLAGYYTFARLRQDGPSGYADGLELVAALIDRFGEQVLPARSEAKRGALEWLAAARLLDLLELRGGFAPEDLERVAAALSLILANTEQWASAARPNLQPLFSRFESEQEPVIEAPVRPSSVPVSADSGTTVEHKISSVRDLMEQARLMSDFLRDQENGYLPAVKLIRCIRWDTVHFPPPADGQGRTRLAPPRSELRQHLRRLAQQKKSVELLDRIESAFTEGANHFWFDLQYFQFLALEGAGSPYEGWRDALCMDFAQMLERLGGIQHLEFADGTPFADDTTLDWIAKHATARPTESDESLASLPFLSLAVAGDDVSHEVNDWRKLERQANTIVKNSGIDAAFEWLVNIGGVYTERQRYHQRWLMAKIADHAGKADMAQHLLSELNTKGLHLDLERWEPELVFEVKHHLLRMVKQNANRKDVDKAAQAKRIEHLTAELMVLDPARALAFGY